LLWLDMITDSEVEENFPRLLQSILERRASAGGGDSPRKE
jgi:hypothetical protein